MACDKTVILLATSPKMMSSLGRLTRLDWSKNWSHASELGVEVASIRRALNSRHERRLHTLVVDVVPDNVAEEWLAHHFLGIRRSASQSLIGLTSEELLEDRNRVSGHVDGVQGLIGENGVVNFVLILSSEWRLLEEHLVNQDTKRPPIDSTPILLIEQDLEPVSEQPISKFSKYRTSGAINSGVPQKVLVVEAYHISSLHKP